MKTPRSIPLALALAAAGLSAAGAVQAQANTDASTPPGSATAVPAGPGIGYTPPDSVVRTTQAGSSGSMSSYSGPSDAYSLLPWTRRGWVGINVGDAKFKTSCGSPAFGCGNPDASLRLSTGGLFNDWVGMELAYLYTGEASRAGGTTSAQGLSLSLVLRAPLGAFNAFLKGGGIYAQTKVAADATSGIPTGKERGWGGVYGAGVGFDLTPSQGLVLEWSRAELKFPGIDKQNFDSTSLGYVYRF
jgi:hypothetical protein